MDFTKLSDSDLLQKLESIGRYERTTLVAALRCLGEVEKRRLYSELGHTSLFDYCTKKLRYPEDQAQRRIVAMRLMGEIPELGNKIATGSLTLTTIGLACSHIRREKVNSKEEKIRLLEALEGMSSREAEKYLAEIANFPIAIPPDRIRVLNSELIELRFSAKESVRRKIETLRGSVAHQLPELSLGALFELLCDWGLKKTQRNQPAAPRVTPQNSHKPRKPRKPTLREQVFARDNHQCTRCHSTHALELDHVIPKAKGGATTLDNLRVLCRSCNQRAAINEYGQEKMNQYL